MKRYGFTMIELIFVIVIVAVLAVVAIPKLAATRDDARASAIAQDAMTGAFEVATYAVSRGMTASTLTEMSNAVTSLVEEGHATENGTDVTIGIGNISDCMHLKIENQGANVEVIKIVFTGSGGNCDTLKGLIDPSVFPMPLHGSLVSY
jgi:general secretion pathway protein G